MAKHKVGIEVTGNGVVVSVNAGHKENAPTAKKAVEGISDFISTHTKDDVPGTKYSIEVAIVKTAPPAAKC
jgi:hypothetical protein